MKSGFSLVMNYCAQGRVNGSFVRALRAGIRESCLADVMRQIVTGDIYISTIKERKVNNLKVLIREG